MTAHQEAEARRQNVELHWIEAVEEYRKNGVTEYYNPCVLKAGHLEVRARYLEAIVKEKEIEI